ncbi:hypothetical protein EON64_08005, partial [archaeon]
TLYPSYHTLTHTRTHTRRCDLRSCLHLLHTQHKVYSVLLEGGGELITSMLCEGLVDQLVCTVSLGYYFNGYNVLRSDKGLEGMACRLRGVSAALLDNEIILHGMIQYLKEEGRV